MNKLSNEAEQEKEIKDSENFDERVKQEKKLFKEIEKTKKGLFLLYNKKSIYSVIVPYFSVREINLNNVLKYCYGSIIYNYKKELTEQQTKEVLNLWNKQKKLRKQDIKQREEIRKEVLK